MPTDDPARPGVAALLAELEVRRRARIALAVAVAFALAVFLAFAYLPGTEESLLYWASLAAVLAFAVFALVATILVGAAAHRRALAGSRLDPGRPSPTTLAVAVGLLGWVAVPVVASVALAEPNPADRLAVALATAGFVVLVVGGLGLKVVGALSLTHAWRPATAAAGVVAYTALVAAPAVACPSEGPCLGTPDQLVAATVGLDPGAVGVAYALVVLGGGVVVGAAQGLRGAAPPHGFLAGVVACLSTLPIVAAATGDPATVRTTALYLPLVLGTAGAVGGAVVVAVRSWREPS